LFWSNPVPKLLDQFISAEPHQRPEIRDKIALQGHKALEHILERLASGRLFPEFGVDLLAALQGEDMPCLLIEGMGSDDDKGRDACQKALEKSHMPMAAAAVAHALDDPDHHIRAGAERLLINHPKSIPVEKILHLLKSQDKDHVRKGINVLSAAATPRAVEAIAHLLTHSHPWFRKKAVDGLVGTGSHDVADKLCDLVEAEKDSDVLKSAIHALGYLGSPKVAVRLVPLLESPDLLLRQMASHSIVEMGDSTSVAPVVALMRSKEKDIRRITADTLGGLTGPGILQALVQALRDADWWVREIAVATLAERADEESNKMVVGLLSDKDPYIRRIGAEYFSLVRYPQALAGLDALLKDEDWWTRERSIVALGRQGDPRAIPKILEHLNDKQTRLAVPEALARIPHHDALAALAKLIHSPDKMMRSSTTKAARILGGPNGKKMLEHLAHDHDSEVAGLARRYLAEMTTGAAQERRE